MKITIITINYNNCEGLSKTIHSVVSQTYSKIEYIVIDGGSSDGSVDIIRKNQDRISKWVSEEDNGIYNAMNKGLEYATGDYCLFLNSGDHLVEYDTIEKIVSQKPSADLVSCDMIVDLPKYKNCFIPYDELPTSWSMINRTCFPHPSTLIKRLLFHERQYHEEERVSSDWIFFFESVVYGHASYQHIPIVCSKFYLGGLSTQNKGLEEINNYLYERIPKKIVDDLTKDDDRVMSYAMSFYLLCKPFRAAVYFIIQFFMLIDKYFIKSIQSYLKNHSINNPINFH